MTLIHIEIPQALAALNKVRDAESLDESCHIWDKAADQFFPIIDAQQALLREAAAALEDIFNECGLTKNHMTMPGAFLFQKGRIEVSTHPPLAGLISALQRARHTLDCLNAVLKDGDARA